ncbi:uncharacterized protein NPIL_544341 [Nephila pilipes]|uniref:Uncharacterized protein n=1 Tax=Nephila pilipes TaxID=299642 RepID=A0A8X6TXD8_NEPPI|nr:uncharacterized protein NPIL_544341 [Nephila pilipes]
MLVEIQKVNLPKTKRKADPFQIYWGFFCDSFDLDCIEDMLPALLAIMRNYVPYVTLPISIVIGVIGYNIEGLISDKFTPTKKISVEEERLERQLKEMDDSNDLATQSLKSKSFVPKTVFERNIKP